MRFSQCFFVPVALFAAAASTGCTLYTHPIEVDAEVASDFEAADEPADDPALVTFRTTLNPYGQWLDVPVCGRRLGRVWRPDPRVVGPGFAPYRTGGEWVATDAGWSFESDWDWGWAPFHYGRWCSDASFGWVWVPGTQWASAWVDWRVGGGFIGWAPLPPRGVRLSDDHFFFVERPRFAGQRVTHYGLPPERVREAQRVARPVRTVVDHRTHRAPAGPAVNEVPAPDGGPVRPVHVAPPARGRVDRVIIRRH